MSSTNNNISNQKNDSLFNFNHTKNTTIEELKYTNLNKKTNCDTPDELEDKYLYFINNKIKQKECIYSPRPPKKNKGLIAIKGLELGNYQKKKEYDSILPNSPNSLDTNKTYVVSSLKPIIEEPIDTFKTKPYRHNSLPNIKLGNRETNTSKVSKYKTDYPNIEFTKLSKTLKSFKSNNLPTINELNIVNNYKENNLSSPKSINKNSIKSTNNSNYFKKITQCNDIVITKEGKYIFKSNYRLKKYLITIKSNNYNVNHIIENYICKRMSLTKDTEEWVWYNLKYQFSFHINYNINNYGDTNNYQVFIKYSKNKVLNLDNLLRDSNNFNLDNEMKKIFINILENNSKHYWQLNNIKYKTNTKYISYAILAPLQYYNLYLDNLESNTSKVNYNKFIKILHYYGNIEMNDEYLHNNLKKTIYTL